MVKEGLEESVAALRAAQPDWAQLGAEGRAGLLLDLAKVLHARRAEVAVASAELDTAVASLVRLASEGPGWLASPGRVADAPLRARPLGVVAVVEGPSAPLAGPLRWLAPALLAGNACLLVPSDEAKGTALALRRALEDAQLPRGVVRLAPGATAEELLALPVDAVAWSGEPPAGWAERAGRAGQAWFVEAEGAPALLPAGHPGRVPLASERRLLLAFCKLQALR